MTVSTCVWVHLYTCSSMYVCECVWVPVCVISMQLCVYLSAGIMDPHGPALAVYELQRKELIQNRSTLNYHLLSHLGFCSLFSKLPEMIELLSPFPLPFSCSFFFFLKLPFVKLHKDCLIVWKSKIVSRTRVNRAKVQMGEK